MVSDIRAFLSIIVLSSFWFLIQTGNLGPTWQSQLQVLELERRNPLSTDMDDQFEVWTEMQI